MSQVCQHPPKPQRKNAPTGSIWTPESVPRLCEKPVYKGWASRYLKQDTEGRGPAVKENAHPALATDAGWDAAQMTPRLTKREDKPLPLLSELIRCQGCRFSMSLGRGPNGERVYRCRRKHASGECPTGGSVMADTIERYVEEMVLLEIDGLVKFVPDPQELERATAELQLARDATEDLRRDREARRKLGPARWHEWLDDCLRAEREAETALALVNQRVGVVRAGLTRDHYLALPLDERREVLAGFIDCLFVRRSSGRGRNVDLIDARTRILWRGQAPDDLPRRRVINQIASFDFDDHVEAGFVTA